MNALLDFFRGVSAAEACGYLFLENVLLFLLALAFGHLLVWVFARHRVVEQPARVHGVEIFWAALCVVLNTVVTVVGWYLWRGGVIVIVTRVPAWRVGVDVVVLLLAMDFAMYVFHRMAHWRWMYPWMHSTHHRYDKPRPLNLFVLNPFEVLGFGALWLGVIAVYTSSWMGIVIYLALNLLFGTVGHLGVEPLPGIFMRLPVLRHMGTSTFHARHHQDRDVNFGFYTDVWDRLFKTLHRRYVRTFGRLDGEPSGRG